MKLIIQIPCLNEEETLPETVRDLPKEIPGVSRIEVLIVDDGSTDRTAQVARELGVGHIIRHQKNRGLAAAFQTGLDRCLALDADIIVNTDADHQYPGTFIPSLIRPILEGQADLAIGDRNISSLLHLPWTHRLLQRMGTSVVRRVSGTDVPDAPSGFRALSREAAMRMEVLTGYTYTLETILQAGRMGMKIATVPIQTNRATRGSRLKRSELQYVFRSAVTILRLYALYQPLKTFLLLAVPFLIGGVALWVRYLVLFFLGAAGRGAHIQSVVVGAALILISVLFTCLGVLGDLMARARALAERTLYLAKRALYGPPHDALSAGVAAVLPASPPKASSRDATAP